MMTAEEMERRIAALPPEIRELYFSMISHRRAFPRMPQRMHDIPIAEFSGKPAPPVSVEPAKPKATPGFIENAPLSVPGLRWVDAICNADAVRGKISRAIDAKDRAVERILDEMVKNLGSEGGSRK